MHFAERIASVFSQIGEQFTIGGFTHLGAFKILDSATINSYLDDDERMAVTHPALLLVTVPDVVANVGDTLIRDGRTYVVFKTAVHRIADTPVMRTIVLS